MELRHRAGTLVSEGVTKSPSVTSCQVAEVRSCATGRFQTRCGGGMVAPEARRGYISAEEKTHCSPLGCRETLMRGGPGSQWHR